MEAVNFFKVASPPGSLEPDSIYYVLLPGGLHVDTIVTDSSGNGKSAGVALIDSRITAALTGLSVAQAEIVTDIDARDDLIETLEANQLIFVMDASDDSEVSSGSALYIYEHGEAVNPGEGTVHLVPGVASHSHSNAAVLNKLGEASGNLTYNGSAIANFLDQVLVGAIQDFAGLNPPSPSWLPMSGQLILRAEYPLLWAFAQNSDNIVADSAWAANKGKFSDGDGITTFRLPDTRGEFRRSLDLGAGVDPGRVIGSAQADQFESHQHDVYSVTTTATAASSGTSLLRTYNANVSGFPTKVYGPFVAPTGGAETRPRNVAYRTFIYAGTPV